MRTNDGRQRHNVSGRARCGGGEDVVSELVRSSTTARMRGRPLLLLALSGLAHRATARGGDDEPANGVEPRDEPLRSAFRPPQQTAAQAKAMAKVYAAAATDSAAARPWALAYMGSAAVRSRLHASLQHYSNEQLLAMFSWEFERLPLFHNAPLDSFGATLFAVQDDTPLNVTLDNGYLQNVCQRYVLGGPESWWSTVTYGAMFIDGFGVEPDSSMGNGNQCVFTSSLRSANDCLLYNANNLFKSPGGNDFDYGSVTYLLNRKVMSSGKQQRLLWEIWDGGLVSIYNKAQARYGTVDPPAFYHLLQPHEEVWTEQAKANGKSYSIADVFNRWWVKGAPLPDAGPLPDGAPYFEVMADNVWLPEDLLAILMPYNDVWMQQNDQAGHGAVYCDPNGKNHAEHPCFPYGSPRGQPLGDALRNWTRAQERPLIWGGQEWIPEPRMILDPYVLDGLSWSGHGAITEEERATFERLWLQGTDGPSKTAGAGKDESFMAMARSMPPQLQLYWPSYFNRSACEEHEGDPTAMILGTDGNGDCVYWTAPAPPPPPAIRFECLNDGTCARSSTARAVFSSEAACLSGCAHAWECVSDIPHVYAEGRKYCLPKLHRAPSSTTVEEEEASVLFPLDTKPPLLQSALSSSSSSSSSFSDLGSCEASCQPEGPGGFGVVCYNIWLLGFLLFLIIASCSMCCFGCAAGFVAPRQQGDGGWSTPLHAVNADWQICILGTLCPCWLWAQIADFKEWRRPIGSYDTTERFLLCGTYLFCGVIVMRCCVQPFGCCTRPALRNKLGGIKGTCKQDMLIHCLAHFCALCQEAREIKLWEERQRLEEPQTPLATAAPVDVPYLDAGSGAAQPLLLGSVGGGGERTESPLRERLLVN